jgi:hypothetical protein
MDWLKYRAYLIASKRLVLPVLFGAIVGWLIRHNHSEWANVVCAIATALGVSVNECIGI